MKLRPPITGLCVFGLTLGLAGVVWWTWPASAPVTDAMLTPATTKGFRPHPASSTLRTRDLGPDRGPQTKPVAQAQTVPGPGRGSRRPATAPDSPWSPVQPVQPRLTEAELQQRVARVEQAANRDLQQLVGLLDLSEAQQDRIFGTLVRRSPDWLPAMQPVGVGAPGTPTLPLPVPSAPELPVVPPSASLPDVTAERPLLDDIASELTPGQQEELANAELDRIAWWEEIIPQLLPPDDTPLLDVASGTDTPAGSNPGNGTAAAAAPPPPAAEEVKEGGEEIILD